MAPSASPPPTNTNAPRRLRRPSGALESLESRPDLHEPDSQFLSRRSS